MADMENDDDVPKLMDFNASSHHEDSSATHNHVRLEEESLTRPGAQLDDKQSFTNKSDETVNCYPVIVDFRRLLQLTDDTARTRLNEFGIIPGVNLMIPNDEVILFCL